MYIIKPPTCPGKKTLKKNYKNWLQKFELYLVASEKLPNQTNRIYLIPAYD